MKTAVIADDGSILPGIAAYLQAQDEVHYIVSSEAILREAPEIRPETVQIFKHDIDRAMLELPGLEAGDQVLVWLSNVAALANCLELLATLEDGPAVIVIQREEPAGAVLQRYSGTYNVSLPELLRESLETILKRQASHRKVEKIQALSKSFENVLILLQNDPDPDAIASGLALRVLMGRNKQTAPLATFGEVTRSENLSMIRLLDIAVLRITPEDLPQYHAIALVDVQPPYFKDAVKADIVIDHHPCSTKYDAAFADVRTAYGSTSTILSEYLIHENYKITQRLATALLYGIKTDTMFLERGISPADIKAFTFLYPLANINMVRQIENPNLEYREINYFVRALKNIVMCDTMLFTHIGRVDREDIISRLADFCLQIGGAEWAIVSGHFRGQLICSVRNVGYVKHAGELVSRAFSSIGSAGGHRSMAKAVIPLRAFKKHARVSLQRDIAGALMRLIAQAHE